MDRREKNLRKGYLCRYAVCVSQQVQRGGSALSLEKHLELFYLFILSLARTYQEPTVCLEQWRMLSSGRDSSSLPQESSAGRADA